MISWAIEHAEDNPGHQTHQSDLDPGSCATCGAKSPMYDLPRGGPS